MRFYCAACQAKYNVDDNKLPEGKVLRIACKKCGAAMRISAGKIIEGAVLAPTDSAAPNVSVTGSAAVAPAKPAVAVATGSKPRQLANTTPVINQGPQVSTAPVTKPAPAKERWYFLVGQERKGPYDIEEFLALYSDGTINKVTLIWHKGMANWQSLGEVASLSAQISAIDAKKQAVAAPPSSVTAVTPEAIPNELSFSAFDALMEAPPEANVGQVFNNDGSKEKDNPFKPTPMPEVSADYYEAPPGEATRIFYATAGIYKRRRNQKIAAIIIGCVVISLAAFIVADANGWIQLPGMGALYEKTDMLDPNKERGIERIQTKLTRKDLTPEEREALRKKLHLYEEVDVKSLTQVDGKKGGAKKGKGGKARGSANNGNNVAQADDFHEEFKKEAPANQGSKEELMASMFNDNRKKDTKVELNLNTKVSTSDLPAGLTQDAITSVISDSKKSLSLCTAEAMKAGEKLSGRMEVEFTIQGTGKVSEVNITTKKFKETRFASCITRTVQRWTFPRFNGEPVTVSYPIIITLGI